MVDIERYRQGFADCFTSDELSYQLGLLLHDLGYWQEATQSYQEAIAQNQQHIEAYLSLGILYELRGSLEVAISIYRQAIDHDLKDVRIYNNLGHVLAQRKAFQEAIEIYQQALQIEPESAVIYNNLGRTFLEQKQIEQALTAFEQAIILAPHLASVHYNLGYLWEQRGDYQQAAIHFQKVIALEPENLSAYGHYSNTLMAQGKLREAMDCLRQAIMQQPAWIDSYCQRTDQLQEDNLLDKAQLSCIHFLRALQQSSDFSIILNHLGQTYRAFGDVCAAVYEDKRAESYYQKAIQTQPKNAELYWHLGNCLSKQQRTEAAIAIYLLGLSLQENHVQIIFSLGNLLVKQQRFAEALRCYEQILQQSEQEVIEPLQLSPFVNQTLQLPQGIFEFTQNWIERTKVTDCHYQIIDRFAPTSFKTIVEDPSIFSPHVSVPPCQGVNCNSCLKELCDQFAPVALTSGVYQILPHVPSLNVPPTFIVTMPEGRVWTSPKKSFWMPCKSIAVITPDHYLLRDLSRDYPWYLPNCQRHDPSVHGMFRRDVLPPLEPIEGTVVVLTGLSGHMYYHWLMDVLPRIDILQRSRWAIERIDWFLINTIEQDFQRETLATLGIPSEKLLSSDQHPYIQAKQLIIPSFPGHAHWATPESMTFLRDHFLKTIDTSLANPKKLYVSRANAYHRQVINEAEVRQVLESMGFVTVFLEQYPLQKQIDLFQSAEIIVSPHGGGLTNLVFCRPGTKIIEIFSPNYVRSDYWVISQQLELQHYYFKGKNLECVPLRKLMYQSALTEDIWVDIKVLKLALEVVLNHSVVQNV